MFAYSNLEMEKEATPNVPYNVKQSGLLSISFLLVKKQSDLGESILSYRSSS